MSKSRIKLGRLLYRWARALYGLPMAVDGLDFDTCALCGESGCEAGTVEHQLDCPSITGVYPVMARDLWPNGMVCERCNTELWPGDSYSLIEIGEGSIGSVTAPMYEVSCTGCAVLAGVEPPPPEEER